jgi:hypothetical protein
MDNYYDADDSEIDDNSSILSSISTSKKIITNRDIYLYNFDKNEEELKKNGGKIITEFQYNVAKKIYNYCNDGNKKHSLIVAETQMGKTGIMQALTREFVEYGNIEPENILILTGLSSCEWVRQTQNRFIEMIRPNIFHRNSISKFTETFKTKKDLLILLDEIHIATNLINNLGITFKECGLLNIDNLIERNIKLIQISATPDAILTELYKWDEKNFNVFVIKSPDEYIGVEKLLNNNQILEYQSLIKIENVHEIRKLIHSKYKNNYKYHLIRIPTNKKENDIIVKNINDVFNNETFDIKYFCVNKTEQLSVDDDLNDIYLNRKPKKHTIIILKEKVRCSYTINKEYVGILYERKASYDFNEMTIIQGLAGRACGYYDNSNKDIIVFSNIDIIKNYIEKIKNNHNVSLYESKTKIKNINNKDINYNKQQQTDIKNNDVLFDKTYNIEVISVSNKDMRELTDGIKKAEVFKYDIFNKILEQKNYYDFYYNYDRNQHYKLTYLPKNNSHILKHIDEKKYIDYDKIYGISSPQYKKIIKSDKTLITIVNKYQNEIYLISYKKILN